MPDTLTVVLAGGGTAGHVNPLLATADKLTDMGHRCFVIGTKEGLESDLVPKAGYELMTIDRVPMPRKPTLDLLKLPRRLHDARHEVDDILYQTVPDVVIGFGGYVSTPAYLAARKQGVPYVIHEQNARPGLANRLGARWADVVTVTFPSTPLHARRGQTHTVGLPLRQSIYRLAVAQQDDPDAVRRRAAAMWDLDPDKPIVVVTGGSLGALQINDAWCQAMPKLPTDLQVIHLTGKDKDAPVIAARDKAGMTHYRIRDYLVDMEHALACADLVVCRSGAGTVSEMSALGIPAVYVPLAVGNGEQRLNATDVVKAGGAVLVDNESFDTQTLFSVVLPLLNDAKLLSAMSSAAYSVGRIDAAQQLATIAVDTAGNN